MNMKIAWAAVVVALLLWSMGNRRAGRAKLRARARGRANGVIFGIDNAFGAIILIGIFCGVLVLLGVIPYGVLGGGR